MAGQVLYPSYQASAHQVSNPSGSHVGHGEELPAIRTSAAQFHFSMRATKLGDPSAYLHNVQGELSMTNYSLRTLALVSAALLVLVAPCAVRADSTFTITDSGWIQDDGFGGSSFICYPSETNCKNYSSGSYWNATRYVQVNNFFAFNLSGLTGKVTSASFNVDSYTIDGPGTYFVYATSLSPADVVIGSLSSYNALTSGALIGSIALAPTDSNELLSLSLNSTGLSWLQANEGGTVVLGGSFPQGPGTSAFGYSSFGLDLNNNLDIQSSETATPEPSSIFLLGSGLAGLAGLIKRKLAAQSQAGHSPSAI
jgi:hypothetical protein